ncbi:MAG: hypothetical protein II799_07095 [Lachnospiraceae bacterium]|nr:hypothetical protein [Lachnospiraceae bacterium]
MSSLTIKETQKKEPKAGMSIGVSSILVIFIIICLVTFSVMSLVSARADYTLSKKIADRNRAYYNATSDAQIKLRDMSQAPRETTQITEFDVPIEDSDQHIHVTAILPADITNEKISILSWQVEESR